MTVRLQADRCLFGWTIVLVEIQSKSSNVVTGER